MPYNGYEESNALFTNIGSQKIEVSMLKVVQKWVKQHKTKFEIFHNQNLSRFMSSFSK